MMRTDSPIDSIKPEGFISLDSKPSSGESAIPDRRSKTRKQKIFHLKCKMYNPESDNHAQPCHHCLLCRFLHRLYASRDKIFIRTSTSIEPNSIEEVFGTRYQVVPEGNFFRFL